MTYTLATPIHVGDLNNPLTVDKLELSAISINLDPQPTLSVVLIHRASGWKHTVTYQDETVVPMWQILNSGNAIISEVFSKMISDAKLLAGTLA